MPLTPLGKNLRRMRLDKELLLKNMADGIGVTSSFLSAIETGKKQPPSDFIDRVSAWAKLTNSERVELQAALDQSIKESKIRLTNNATSEDRETIAVLARTFGEMSEEKKRKLRNVILRGQ